MGLNYNLKLCFKLQTNFFYFFFEYNRIKQHQLITTNFLQCYKSIKNIYLFCVDVVAFY